MQDRLSQLFLRTPKIQLGDPQRSLGPSLRTFGFRIFCFCSVPRYPPTSNIRPRRSRGPTFLLPKQTGPSVRYKKTAKVFGFEGIYENAIEARMIGSRFLNQHTGTLCQSMNAHSMSYSKPNMTRTHACLCLPLVLGLRRIVHVHRRRRGCRLTRCCDEKQSSQLCPCMKRCHNLAERAKYLFHGGSEASLHHCAVI